MDKDTLQTSPDISVQKKKEQSMKKMFEMIDMDKSGFLTKDEMWECMKEKGLDKMVRRD